MYCNLRKRLAEARNTVGVISSSCCILTAQLAYHTMIAATVDVTTYLHVAQAHVLPTPYCGTGTITVLAFTAINSFTIPCCGTGTQHDCCARKPKGRKDGAGQGHVLIASGVSVQFSGRYVYHTPPWHMHATSCVCGCIDSRAVYPCQPYANHLLALCWPHGTYAGPMPTRWHTLC